MIILKVIPLKILIFVVVVVLLHVINLKTISKFTTKSNGSSIQTVLSRYRPLFNVSVYEESIILPDNPHFYYNESEWPEGTYGLPKPMSGCPIDTSPWETGWRYHDTENSLNENGFSKYLHIDGSVTEEGILHKFCIKTYSAGTYDWPKGRYCFYQFDYRCPLGTRPGYVFWDDENTNNHNRNAGTMPSGSYTTDTEIRFCCRVDGDTSKSIALPSKAPFYLFSYISANCQKVIGMESSIEFIKFDNEDTNNSNSQAGEYPYGIDPSKEDIYFYMCYYVPEDIKQTETPIEISTVSAQTEESIKLDKLDETDPHELDMKSISKNVIDKNTTNNFWFNKFIIVPVGTLIFLLLIILATLLVTKITKKRTNQNKNSKFDHPKINVPKNELKTLDFPEFDNEMGFDDETPLFYDHSLHGWGNSGRQMSARFSHFS